MIFVIKSHESAKRESISSSWQTFARQSGKISTAPLLFHPRASLPFKSRTSEATTIKEQKAEKEKGAEAYLGVWREWKAGQRGEGWIEGEMKERAKETHCCEGVENEENARGESREE